MNNILLTDIGSTTTKALLLTENENEYKIISEKSSSTSVETPFEDVWIGVSDSVSKIKQETDIDFFKEKTPKKYYSSSSAGGGLQMLVLGLTARETGNLAEMTANGAGGVVIKTISATDKSSDLKKIEDMRIARPDIILMAGGIDGGGLWGVLRLAELLKIASPTVKYLASQKIPLIFAGNKQAHKYLKDILSNDFNLIFVDNIRPDMLNCNIAPARNEIHKVFMQQVMECAPGYKKIKDLVNKDILPTPAAVEKVLTFFSQATDENSLLVDIGGATTDIFSNIKKSSFRTVSANTGMSYSLNNLLKDCGLKSIKKHLPPYFSDDILENYVINKSLNPTSVPTNDIDKYIEIACATAGIAFSYKQHLTTTFEYKKIGLSDKIQQKKKLGDINPFEEMFVSLQDNEFLFQESSIKNIIGAGGIFTVQDRLTSLAILHEAFKIKGVTKYYRDKNFKTPHIGLLENRDKAYKLYKENYLELLGIVIKPILRTKKTAVVVEVKNSSTGEMYKVNSGDTLCLNSIGVYVIKMTKKGYLPQAITEIEISDSFLLIDCRFDDQENNSLLKEYSTKLFKDSDFIEYKSSVQKGIDNCQNGEFIFKRELPYKGEVYIDKSQEVNYDTILGQTFLQPAKIYIINLNRESKSNNIFTKDELKKGYLIKIGDLVKKEEPLFKYKMGFLNSEMVINSRVTGVVERLEDDGIVVLKELQNYQKGPITFNIAELMGVDAKIVLRSLKYHVNNFVEKGQILCEIFTYNIFSSLFSKNDRVDNSDFTNQNKILDKVFKKRNNIFVAPSTGYITKIDAKANITIEYKFKPYKLISNFKGKVINIQDDRIIELKVNGKKLQALIGFGQEVNGEVVYLTNLDHASNLEGKIVIYNASPTYENLIEFETMKIKGLVIPAINKRELEKFLKFKTGVILTGYEDISYPIIITEGFGDYKFNKNYASILSEIKEKRVTLLPQTQIRAGVKRAEVVIEL